MNSKFLGAGEWRPTGGRVAALVGVLTLAAACLRIPGLDSGLWFDEIVTLIESVRPPIRQILTAFPGSNNHPLYSLLAHMSVAAFGEHAWTLRLPAFAFGVIGVPMLYVLAVAVTTRREAILAALLLAVSYHHVWFSQNARGYTMLLFFTLAATWMFEQLLERSRTGWALVYGATIGLGGYTHVFMAFVAVAHALVWGWHVWMASSSIERTNRLRTALVAVLAAGVVGGLLYLPMAAQVYRVFTGPPAATAAVATSQWALLEVLRGLRIGFGTIGLLIVLALLTLGGFSYLARDPITAALFLLPGLLTGVVMVVMRAPIRPRFFFSLLGFGLLLLVRGAFEFGRLAARRSALADRRTELAGVMVTLLLAVVSIWSLGYNYRYPKQDFDGALRFVEQHRSTNESVGTAGLASYPFEHYYQRPWTTLEKREQFERLRGASRRAWVVYSFPEYMDPELRQGLHDHCPTQQVFIGTLGGGDVLVCVTDP